MHEKLVFEYGVPGSYVNVTPQVRTRCVDGVGTLTLPATDEVRCRTFGFDPAGGYIKEIVVTELSTRLRVTLHYAETLEIEAGHSLGQAKITNSNKSRSEWWESEARTRGTAEYVYFQLMDRLHILFGPKWDEGPESRMALRFVSPDSTGVLELGGNVGRNACVLGQILRDDRRLVSLESDPDIAAQLRVNRELNQFNFHIEPAALSRRRLMQYSWSTRFVDDTADKLPDGWKEIKTITWTALKEKYRHLNFDTLIADCEGALFHIVQEEPGFLAQFSTVCLENDYPEAQNKQYVDEVLVGLGFSKIYSESLMEADFMPCRAEFFEAWSRPGRLG